MSAIIDGNALVIRDGETVVAIFYEKFYDGASELLEEALSYAKYRELESPNFSVMKIADSRFLPLEKNEADRFSSLFSTISKAQSVICKNCGSLCFVFPNKASLYCPKCKESSF